MMSKWEKKYPYFFLIPALALSLLVVAYPLYIDFFYSVQRVSSYFLPSKGFAGTSNFVTVLRDPIFWVSLRNSILLAAGSAGLQSVVGLGVASLLSYKFVGNTIVRIGVLFPWIMPQAIATIMWKTLLSPLTGPVNTALSQLGLIHGSINWLGDPVIVWPTVIAINVWESYPFYAIALLAAMGTVSRDLKESALVDGAGMFSRFRHVVLPELWPILTIVNLFSIVWSINGLAFIYTLTNGGPGLETMVLSVYTYTMMFQYFQLSQATAQALIMIAVQLGLLYFLLKRTGGGFRQQ